MEEIFEEIYPDIRTRPTFVWAAIRGAFTVGEFEWSIDRAMAGGSAKSGRESFADFDRRGHDHKLVDSPGLLMG